MMNECLFTTGLPHNTFCKVRMRGLHQRTSASAACAVLWSIEPG